MSSFWTCVVVQSILSNANLTSMLSGWFMKVERVVLNNWVAINLLYLSHDPRLGKYCISSDPLTLPQGRLTGVKLC